MLISQLNLLLLSWFLQITVMDEMWTVFRRYSRFREMHKSLKLKYPEVRGFVASFQQTGWQVVGQVAPGHDWTSFRSSKTEETLQGSPGSPGFISASSQ